MSEDEGLLDEWAEKLAEEVKGSSLVFAMGEKGRGFSVRGPMEFQLALPEFMRLMADKIEESELYNKLKRDQDNA